jgi:hypothetical protein
MIRINGFYLTSLFILTVLYGCSSSELVNTWKDEEFLKENKFQKLLVIAIGEHTDRQKLFENLFKKNFEKENVEVIKSHPILGSNRKLNKEEIINLVSELKVDGVLITHLKNTESETTYSPNVPTQISGSNYGSMYIYYQSTYDYIHSPGYLQAKVKVLLETRLFDAKDERVVWSAISSTIDPKDIREAIEDIQDLIISRMKKEGVI